MKTKPLAIVFALLSGVSANSAPRTSTNYTIATDTADAGGKRATSASYTNDGSAGLVSGISNVTVPAETAKSGYIGQLYDVTGLVVNSAQPSVNEGATLQLAAWLLLDDATYLATNANAVTWGIVSGPVTGVSASGLATAGPVFQGTSATVQGTFGGFTASLSVTVLDSIPDNFGSYSGDGVGDDWQVQYFGLPPNANAGPNIDFDHTGQTNLFKYTAGLNPLDPNSRFTLTIARTPDPLNPGQFLAGQKNLIFNPRFADRTYTVRGRTSLLNGAWSAINGSAPSDNGTTRTITDLSATPASKFYHVEITKP